MPMWWPYSVMGPLALMALLTVRLLVLPDLPRVRPAKSDQLLILRPVMLPAPVKVLLTRLPLQSKLFLNLTVPGSIVRVPEVLSTKGRFAHRFRLSARKVMSEPAPAVMVSVVVPNL